MTFQMRGFFFLIVGGFAYPLCGETLDQSIQRLDPSYVTPHIPWANPLDGGPIRAVVVAPCYFHRDTLELAQRLELELVPVLTWNTKSLGHKNFAGTSLDPRVVEQNLEEKVKGNWDVCVLGRMEWSAIPLRLQLEMLTRVKEGAGLLMVMPGEFDDFMKRLFELKGVPSPPFITGSVPLTDLPGFTSYKSAAEAWSRTIQTAQLGKGRICVLRYPDQKATLPGLTPAVPLPESLAPYEYYQALLIKAVLWIASRDGDLALNLNYPKTVTASDKDGPAAILSVELNGKSGPSRSLHCEIILRDERGTALPARSGPVALQNGQWKREERFEGLARGKYYIEATVLANGKVVAWSTGAWSILRPEAITNLEMLKPSFEPDEAIAGRVRVSGNQPGDMLRLALKDNLGRLLQMQEQPADQAEFRFSPVKALVVLHHIEVELLRGGEALCRNRTEFSVRPCEDPMFFMCMWVHAPSEVASSYQELSQLKRWGVDVVYPYHRVMEAHAIARNNLRAIPYLTRIFFTGPCPNNVRSPCLTDPQYRESLARELKIGTEIYAPFFPIAYSLGDENSLSAYNQADVCASPTCKEDLRKWLSAKYGGLERFNEAWKTNCRSWDDVQPVFLAEAQKDGYLIPWLDHRRHMDEVYADIHRYGRDVIRAIDPKACVGFEGGLCDNTWGGADYTKLGPDLRLFAPYFSPLGCEVLHSLTGPDTITGYWAGGYPADRDRENRERWHPWNALFYGLRSVWWWWSSGLVSSGTFEGPALKPDLTPFRDFAWYADEVGKIKKGIAHLLLQSRRMDSGIALYYNRLGSFTATAAGRDYSLGCFVQLVKDCGWQGRIVADGDLLGKEFTPRRYPVLLLADGTALTAHVEQAVSDYVKQGGTVILNELPRWTLDGEAPRTTAFTALAKAVAGGKKEISFGQGTIKLFAPAGLTDYGAVVGSAERATRVSGGNEYEIRKQFLATLGSVPQTWPIKLDTPDHEPFFDGEVFLWQNGVQRYLGIIRYPREKGADIPLEVTLDRQWQVYDLINKQPLGGRKTLGIPTRPGQMNLYALLPKEPGKLMLETRVDQADQAEATFRATTGDSETFRVVRMEVHDSAGKPVAHYARNVTFRGKEGRATIPLALNDVPGAWTVTAEDVVTGQRATTRFNLPAQKWRQPTKIPE